MFKVSIIISDWHYWANPLRIQPIHELYFATAIDAHFLNREVRVNLIDLRGIQPDRQVYHILKSDLYFYWIPKTGDYLGIQRVVDQLRQVYPQARHAAGGTHIDIFPEESAQVFDAIVIGPGEESFVSIIDDCLKANLQKIYKSDYKDINYGNYPFMRRHYLPETAIVNTLLFEKYGKDIRSTCVLFSRGCSFRCKFCIYNVPNAIQMRTPQSIEEEINYLKQEYKIKAINLKDEICIPIIDTAAIPFLEAVQRSKIIWRGQTTVAGISEEKIRLAKESGCVELAVGVESASQQVMDILDKKIKLDQVINFINLCKKYSIKVKMCLIFGLPGEPENILDLTRTFIEEAGPDYVSLSGLDPVPGSEIYSNFRYYGIKDIDTNWEKHAHLLYRFSDYEEVGIPFEYEKTNRWGKAFSRAQIIENIQKMQGYFREHKMIY